MEESMTTASTEDRGKLWPILLVLLGSFNIVDYFYKFTFAPADLLVGLGLLLMAPLAYFYPSTYRFRKNAIRVRPSAWTKWLSYLGIMLAILGFTIKWL